ncbi:hypothetical protein MPLB_2110010 [Mesorhizobium sp. ORS 3324]|nr:hypothetical protein MPLB_2110010 [Mesorhizobium sp. ORS 3324]
MGRRGHARACSYRQGGCRQSVRVDSTIVTGRNNVRGERHGFFQAGGYSAFGGAPEDGLEERVSEILWPVSYIFIFLLLII